MIRRIFKNCILTIIKYFKVQTIIRNYYFLINRKIYRANERGSRLITITNVGTWINEKSLHT